MDELVHLLHQLLKQGVIKIDVSIKVTYDDTLPGETTKKGNFRTGCTTCGFVGWYYSPDSAERALRAKRQHCALGACPKQMRADAPHLPFVQEHLEGENNE